MLEESRSKKSSDDRLEISNAIVEDPTPDQLTSLSEDDFLPPISPWMVIGGLALVGGLGIAIGLSSIMNFKVTVKALGSFRPIGDLRLVESELDGTVVQISAMENQVLQAGDVIASLDRSRLQTVKRQLQEDIEQKELQLAQINAQLNTLDSRYKAESDLIARTINAAEESLRLQERRYREQLIITEANLAEANSELQLARAELERYIALEGTGIVSQHQIDEKIARVSLAEAKLKRAEAQVSPINAEIAIAQQEIAQQLASGRATQATLQQQREQMLQRRIDMENQMQTTQKELDRVEFDLDRSVVRAPINGTLHQLNLRNPGQVLNAGEGIAYIAPLDMPLEFKANVASQDISKVELDQPVDIRVSACPYTDYGILDGSVTSISPDSISSGVSGNNLNNNTGTFYEITITPDRENVGEGENQCQLQPGMEGKADIISSEETVLTFLLRKARLITNI